MHENLTAGFALSAGTGGFSVRGVDRLKVILMGSGALACPLLEGILAAGRDELVAVVTQPDRAGGRGLQSLPCVVKTLAQSRNLPVFTPENASDDAFVAQLAALQPDVAVVACYGQFLKKNLLAVPRIGTINVHPSLLPKYRGASPLQWTLANGETETGVTVLHVTPKMDAGDVLAQEKYPILPDDDYCSLEPKLAAKGAELLVRVLDEFRAGRTQGVPQDDAQATFARKLAKEDGLVDWSRPAEAIRNQLRGFAPWPGAYTFLPGGILLKLHAVRVEPETAHGAGSGRGGSPGGDGQRCAAAAAGAAGRQEVHARRGVPVRPQAGGRRAAGVRSRRSAALGLGEEDKRISCGF